MAIISKQTQYWFQVMAQCYEVTDPIRACNKDKPANAYKEWQK